MSLSPILLQAGELGIRLEIVKDLTTRQVPPVVIELECGCQALV